MVLISAEPVIFLYVYCYSAMIFLGQNFILERLCLQQMGNVDCSSQDHQHKNTPVPDNIDFSLVRNGSSSSSSPPYTEIGDILDLNEMENSYDHNWYGQNEELGSPNADSVRSQAVHLYMFVTATNAITSVVSSQVLGYWMDRMSRKVLMTAPVAGGILWVIAYILVAYFKSCSIHFIFIGVFFGGITGGYVTLKTAVTSYIVQETPSENRTVRLSVLEASIFLGGSASLFSMNLATNYLTKNFAYLFMGVQGGFILCSIYIFCFLRNDVEIEYPHLKYSYDDLDGPAHRQPSVNRSYGSMAETPISHRRFNRHVADSIARSAGRDKNYTYTEEDDIDSLYKGNKYHSAPRIEVDRCSSPEGGSSRGTSQRLHGAYHGSLQASSSVDENVFASAVDIQPHSAPSLAVSIRKTKSTSTNSVYGTPPDIVVTGESPPGESLAADKSGLLNFNSYHHLFKSITASPSVKTVTSAYGTPPEMSLATDDDHLDQNEVKRTSAGDTDLPDYKDLIHRRTTSKTPSLDLSQQDFSTLKDSNNTSQQHIIVRASVDANGGISNLAVLDRTSPSLTASTITIQTQEDNDEYRIPSINYLRSKKREHFFSMCASDSALDVVDSKNFRSCVKLSSESYLYNTKSKTKVTSVSTPESLNYLGLSENGYTDSENSFNCRDSLCGGFQSDSIGSGDDVVDNLKKESSFCSLILRSTGDAIATTFRRREPGLRAMIIADVIANFFVSFIVIAETDNIYLYLNYKLKWSFSEYTTYFGIKSAVDGAALLFLLPLLRRCFGIKDAALGVLGGLSRSAFFIMLALIQYSSQVYSVPFIGIFGQYLFVSERAIMTSLVKEEEQGRVFTVLCSVDQLALLLGAMTFDNLFSVLIGKAMPGVTLLIAGFLALVPTVIFCALHFSINAHQRLEEEEGSEESDIRERESLLTANQIYASDRSLSA